jgi:hypothetical protein
MAEFNNRRKAKGIAYVLAILLGGVGAHRFYLGEVGYGIALAAFYIVSWVFWAFYVVAAARPDMSPTTSTLALSMLYFVSLPVVWLWQIVVLSRDVDARNGQVADEAAAIARTVAQPEVRP